MHNSIREITEQDLKGVYKLMQQLRPHISEEQFIHIHRQAKKADEYTIYGYYENEKCLGLMGLRYLHDYVHQFHLYIDDLVVDENCRSKGIGARLLSFAEELARKKKCTGLRLCTGAENEPGKRFYEREKWVSRAVVFKKKI